MLAPALTPPRPDALLVPLPPAEAYAVDVDRLSGLAPIGAVDDAWLALAQTLHRAADACVAERGGVLAAGADVVGAVLPELAPTAVREVILGACGGLRQLGRCLGDARRPADRTPPITGAVAVAGPAVAAAAAGVQGAVAQMEQQGAFMLAFSVLAALRSAITPVLDRGTEGLLLAQQGRAARQFGALATARELYDASARAGRAARAPEVTARALIGSGVLASIRGNYPDARALFQRALKVATRAGIDEHRRAAHHGLLFAAVAAKDVETALAHGWAAFVESPLDDSDARAEMLVNLADVGREAGEYRAALGACVRALELAEAARLRLPALGCATIASALLGEHALVDRFISDVEQTVSRSGLSFENARALTEVGEALAILGDFRAFGYASRAALVARRAGFHEITARTLQIEAALNDRLGGVALGQPRLKRVRWSRSTRAIFNRMEVMSIHGQRAAAIGVAG